MLELGVRVAREVQPRRRVLPALRGPADHPIIDARILDVERLPHVRPVQVRARLPRIDAGRRPDVRHRIVADLHLAAVRVVVVDGVRLRRTVAIYTISIQIFRERPELVDFGRAAVRDRPARGPDREVGRARTVQVVL